MLSRGGGARRGKGSPAVFVSAGAEFRCVTPHDHVTKFTCRSASSSINLPVKNNPGTHSVSTQHKDEVTSIPDFGPAKPQLSQSHCVGIIVDGHSQAGGRSDLFADW